MPDGEMRRPPQLWEQRLTRMTGVISVGLSQSGDNTAIVPPEAPPGGGGGVEPAPVAPPPGTFSQPSRPNLIGGIQGITVLWDGLNSDGDLYPYDTSFIEVHTSTSGTGFTVGTATLKGRLARPGGVFVGGLAAGTAHSFRFRGVDPAGNVTVASLGTATQTGLTKGPDIDNGAVTTDKLTAGTITGFFIAGGTITGGFITGGTVSGGFITGGTIEGSSIQTRAGASRIRIDDDVSGPYGSADALEFVDGSTSKALVSFVGAANQLTFYSDQLAFVKRNGTSGINAVLDGEIVTTDITGSGAFLFGLSSGERAFRIASNGEVFSNGVDNSTSASAANVRILADAQIVRSTSTVRLKDELVPTSGDLVGVDPAKIADFPASIDPADVLQITPTEFRSLSLADSEARMFGFIAEDVAAKLPWAANWDDAGLPSAVEDRPILAALLHVVKEQQATIEDLRTRIEALEA